MSTVHLNRGKVYLGMSFSVIGY